MQLGCDYVIENENGDTLMNGATIDMDTGVIDTDIQDCDPDKTAVKSYLMIRGMQFDVTPNENGQPVVSKDDLNKITTLAIRGARL